MGEVDIPQDFGYVAIVAALVSLQHLWMAYEVIRARMKYKVKPPTMYADESINEDAKAFNCVQRAHQNCVESLPIFFILLVLGGIQHPRLNAVLGLAYMAGRFLYFWGYTSGDPNQRMRGMLWVGVLLFLCATTLSFGVQSLLWSD